MSKTSLIIDGAGILGAIENYVRHYNETNKHFPIGQISGDSILPLFAIYQSVYTLHDAFGVTSWIESLMKLLRSTCYYELENDHTQPSADALSNTVFEVELLIKFLVETESHLKAFRSQVSQENI